MSTASAAAVKPAFQPIRLLAATITMMIGQVDINQARITLDVDGKHVSAEADGNGPIDAAFRAIDKMIDHGGSLKRFRVESEGEGTNAPGKSSVDLTVDTARFAGDSTSYNTVRAAIEAYLSAINKIRFSGR